MKCGTFLLVLSFCFTLSCIKGIQGDTLFLHEELVTLLKEISAYITGKQEEVDSDGKVIGAITCEKDYNKAIVLFLVLEARLKKYAEITKCPISQNILQAMHTGLSEIKQHIESLPDGQDRNQLRKGSQQLARCVSDLMATTLGSITHHSPAG